MEKYALCVFIRGFCLTSENEIFTPKKYRISIRVFKKIDNFSQWQKSLMFKGLSTRCDLSHTILNLAKSRDNKEVQVQSEKRKLLA